MFKFFNSLGNKEKIAREVTEIQKWVAGRSITFGAEINAIDIYRDISQMPLALESLAFFMHALSRFSFRQNNERLREITYDPVFHNMAHLYAQMIKKLSPDTPADIEEIVASLITKRELEYAQVKTLLGDTASEKQSVLWLAAHKIAEQCGHHKDMLFIQIIIRNFLQGLEAMELNQRLKRIETAL